MDKSNILLIDDDQIYLYLIEKVIKGLSNKLVVNSFTDGELAVDYIAQCVNEKISLPEIIFLDINMPFMDGWGFLAEFKKLKPAIEDKVTIYMVSSSQREVDKERAANFEELTGYVVKPIEEESLTEIFNEIYSDSW